MQIWKQLKIYLPGFFVISCLFLSGCQYTASPAAEEEAHEHGGGAAVTLWTDATELFFEYPPMIANADGDPWAIHVTRLDDFQPVTEGTLTLAFRAPDGTVFTIQSQAPARAGIYTPAPMLPAPGTYELIVDIAGPQLTDRIRAGSIQVYRAEADLPNEEEEPDASISFLKEQQWPIPFATASVQTREIASTVATSAEIVEAAGHVVEVASPVSGLVLARENLRAPAVGAQVRRGQQLVTLAPTSQDNSFVRSKADAERLTREVERLERLFEAGAVAEKRLIEARHDLEIVEAALAAMGASVGEGYDFPLSAPIAGVIQEQFFVPGARIEVGQPLYRIVDPGVVWLKLRLPAMYAAQAGTFEGAYFTVEGSGRVYESDAVVSVGSSIDPASRTLPVLMSVDNTDGSLKIGLVARAHLRQGEVQSGVAIPNNAILTEDGLPVAYVQVGGESFERRLLTLGASDGEFTQVVDGIAENEHVVTEGAYQVYLASLNTSEISDHGHPH